MTLRKIVKIDEEKCDGCGLCVPSCVEGAIQIIDGKARLLKEEYCDGLGACLGECPQGAITIEERAATQFDPHAVEEHLAKTEKTRTPEKKQQLEKTGSPRSGCPGSVSKSFEPAEIQQPSPDKAADQAIPSQLSNWPVQLRLVPVFAPYLQNARLVIAADCVPFAFSDFHRKFLVGKILLIGCPKLDDAQFYTDKLTEMFTMNDIRSIDVLYMEVPCCFGLVQIVRNALERSGKKIPLTFTKIGIRGSVIETTGQVNSESAVTQKEQS